MLKKEKPEWDEYFMIIAVVVKKRADCLRRQVGAILIKDFRILATGYNGTPRGIRNCLKGGCRRCLMRHQGKLKSGEREDECICLHAEQNAVLQAAYLGVPTAGATLYCTSNPCPSCAKMLINAGIVKVICRVDRPEDKIGLELLRQAKIKVVIFNKSLS
ncbi:MAG: cytidine/deoxycytidylate deaminase family protein [Patescibacteria group bacterium]|nr:cytidine/deoxycytidylate deaminase family protein [Patescibacteria group bacterium]